MKWTDFHGKAPPTQKHAAMTYSGIDYHASLRGKKFTYKAVAFFSRIDSWVRTPTKKVLRHEQGHFNLTEIYTRKFRKAVDEYIAKGEIRQEDLHTLYFRNKKELREAQALYDKETDFSRNAVKQDYWSRKILEQLR